MKDAIVSRSIKTTSGSHPLRLSVTEPLLYHAELGGLLPWYDRMDGARGPGGSRHFLLPSVYAWRAPG